MAYKSSPGVAHPEASLGRPARLDPDVQATLMPLLLRRAQGHRPGDWNPDDFDVLDDGCESQELWQSTHAQAGDGRIPDRI
jgi:hypothetical protein